MIVGILLAAGRSSRFGANKLLHPLPDGTPVAVAAARVLVGVLPASIAVVRGEDRRLMQALEAEGMRVSANPDAGRGMGSSLACGVRAAGGAGAWVVALGDMPFVQAATIARVAQRLAAGAAIVAPEYRGRRGHPVGFAAEFGPRLRQLRGPTGARRLLVAHRGRLESLAVDDPGILLDIDTPADLPAFP